MSNRRRVSEEVRTVLESASEDILTSEALSEEIVASDSAAKKADECEEDDFDKELQEVEAMIAKEEIPVEDDDDDDDEGCIEAMVTRLEAAIKASEEKPGVEDDIQDTAKGGDPTVQEETDMGSGAKGTVESDGEVFPTKSEYVASVKTVTARLDKIADMLQASGRKQLAYRIDVVSDYLDKNQAGK